MITSITSASLLYFSLSLDSLVFYFTNFSTDFFYPVDNKSEFLSVLEYFLQISWLCSLCYVSNLISLREMKQYRAIHIPVTLKGPGNYITWSRMAMTAVGGRGLWEHVSSSSTPKKEKMARRL